MTAGPIAERLDRSLAAIRNLRYKKHLVVRAQDETKTLFQQRDELSSTVRTLQGKKRALDLEVGYLKGEEERLEEATMATRNRLRETLTQRVIDLKWQRPDLFILCGPEQIAMLLRVFLK